MRSVAIQVRREDAERARLWLRDQHLLAHGLRLRRTPEGVQIPVTGSAVVPDVRFEMIRGDFESARGGRPREYRDLLEWPAADRRLLPRAFDVVGDVVLIRLPRELAGRSSEVGEALRKFVPGTRLVGWDHGVHGPDRRRRIERIAGEGPFATVHHENGLALDVNLDTAYFSPRLAREHARVSAAVQAGEVVYDLCCGIGPFSLLIAREGRASRIVAVDANPGAIALLERNRLRVRSPVPLESRVARLEEFLEAAPEVKRVILNLPLEGIKYLTSVGRVVSAAGVLHFYDVTPRATAAVRASEILARLNAGGAGWTVRSSTRVHAYSPDADVVAYDLKRSAA